MPMGKKIPFQNSLKKEIKEKTKWKTHPRKCLHAGKIQNTRQSTASVHSNWTLLQVANVGTHQLIQQMSSNTHKEHVGKKNQYNIQYSIQYIDKINAQNKTKRKKTCFAWVRLQLLENDYCPKCSFLNISTNLMWLIRSTLFIDLIHCHAWGTITSRV